MGEGWTRDMDGISEEGRILITMGAMKSLRRKLWEDKVGWDETDRTGNFLERKYSQRISRSRINPWPWWLLT